MGLGHIVASDAVVQAESKGGDEEQPREDLGSDVYCDDVVEFSQAHDDGTDGEEDEESDRSEDAVDEEDVLAH